MEDALVRHVIDGEVFLPGEETPAERTRTRGDWSEDRTEQLKKLWEGGLSCSQIAAELGNVSRNAVIGKVHRLGLSGRAKSPSSAAPRQRKARPAQQMMRSVARKNSPYAQALEVIGEAFNPDPIAYDNVVPMSQRLSSVVDLNETTCHWPVGDPADMHNNDGSFFFCGGKSLTGLPYCAHHSRVAYQPTVDRRTRAYRDMAKRV
jgi:GcrA cell cycle regulator